MIEYTYVYVRDLKLHHNKLGSRSASAFAAWILELGESLEHGVDTRSSMVRENARFMRFRGGWRLWRMCEAQLL